MHRSILWMLCFMSLVPPRPVGGAVTRVASTGRLPTLDVQTLALPATNAHARALAADIRARVAERFDLDALPAGSVRIWHVDGVTTAFDIDADALPGGRFFAMASEAHGNEEWIDHLGGTLRSSVVTRPLDYRAISSHIGVREHPIKKRRKWHGGTDFAAPIGTPVVAIADGVVARVGKNWGAGKFLVVKHDTGHETRYLHLDRKAKGIDAGVRVQKGDVVGLVGMTGRTTGPHLHFEVRDARGYPVDPARLFTRGEVAQEAQREGWWRQQRWQWLRAAVAPTPQLPVDAGKHWCEHTPWAATGHKLPAFAVVAAVRGRQLATHAHPPALRLAVLGPRRRRKPRTFDGPIPDDDDVALRAVALAMAFEHPWQRMVFPMTERPATKRPATKRPTAKQATTKQRRTASAMSTTSRRQHGGR